MSELPHVKTMKLRYAGTCDACGLSLPAGERAHYLRLSKTVRCLACGVGEHEAPAEAVPPKPVDPSTSATSSAAPSEAALELAQGPITRAAQCFDCGRRLPCGTEALRDAEDRTVLCLECVALDTVHAVGTAGGGARAEHAQRLQRHQTKVRTRHPRLGGLILALSDDPQHLTAWRTGAVGEEAFGQKLSEAASEHLKVLHDRKLPRSSANIDHIAVTSEAVWVLDAKRYEGKKVETRGHGLFSRRPPDLYVGGRNQTNLVEGVKRQTEVVRQVLGTFHAEQGLPDVPVRGGLVFIDAEFGLFSSSIAVDDIWIGWGKAIRKRLSEEVDGPLPVGLIAKRLAGELRAGGPNARAR